MQLRVPALTMLGGVAVAAAALVVHRRPIQPSSGSRSNPVEKAFGATFVLLAVAATITAGTGVGVRTGRVRAAWQAGLCWGSAP